MKHLSATEEYICNAVFITGVLFLIVAVVSCTRSTSANPVDEPETHPMDVSITIYEDAYARCYTIYTHGISCIAKPQAKD